VFDQPDLKARWTLKLEHPAKWQSAANGAELSREAVGDRVTVTFAETEPLPTYLVAFIAGDFKIETAERNGRTFRMFHRETDAGKVARNRDAIFDLHARALEFLERYTSIPYAFGKFDFVAIPAFQFGAWSTRAKSSTTRPVFCSTSQPPRTSCSVGRR
jgi:aminopeptidase N